MILLFQIAGLNQSCTSIIKYSCFLFS